jgi:uncharacterized membrane protein
MTATRWMKLGAVTLTLAGVLHVLVVWLIPYAITSAFIYRVTRQAGYNRIVTRPLPTDATREVVKPSPDLLYAACVIDVSGGPVRISARPPQGYWSLALYDRNSDNFFKVNDSEVKGDRIELILGSMPNAGNLTANFPLATYVPTPHTVGVMLARILVLDQADMQAALAAQASISCDPINSQR